MEQLSKDRTRQYDPANFTFERLDDAGIRHPLNIDMQVKHLHMAGRLCVVPKNSPMMVLAQRGPDHMRTRSLEDHLAQLPPGGQQWQLDPVIGRRPKLSDFFFNEFTTWNPTEYLVTVNVKGSRTRPLECTLVVDRDRLYHQSREKGQGRADSENRSPMERKKASIMSPATWVRKLGKHLSIAEGATLETNLFADRRICDVRSIIWDDKDQCAFVVAYSTAGSGGTSETAGIGLSATDLSRCANDGLHQELVYGAQTPTACAEIVARLRFLQTLIK
jgi:hypothetical protein